MICFLLVSTLYIYGIDVINNYTHSKPKCYTNIICILTSVKYRQRILWANTFHNCTCKLCKILLCHSFIYYKRSGLRLRRKKLLTINYSIMCYYKKKKRYAKLLYMHQGPQFRIIRGGCAL